MQTPHMTLSMNEEKETTEIRAAFEKVLTESDLLDNDAVSAGGIETLYGMFMAGVLWRSSQPASKPQEVNPNFKPARKTFYRRRDKGPVEVKNPDAPASESQYRYIKAMYASDELYARNVMGELFDAAILDMGTLTKGQASGLIDKMVKAGLRPKRARK